MSSPVKIFFKTQESTAEVVSIPGYKNATKRSFYIQVTDIPDDLALWLDVNPRRATPTEIHKGIIETVLENPKAMALKNAGLILSCSRIAESQGKTKGINAYFSNQKIHGLIDGNNSRVAIATAIARADGDIKDCLIEVTLHAGLDQSGVQDLAEGQNIRKPVQKHSLMNYTGYFDTIRQSLGKRRCENIIFHEGDTGTINIQLILQLMLSLNIERYPAANDRPTVYGYSKKVMDIFKDDWEKTPSPSKLLSENADKIYDAYIIVRETMPDLWRGPTGKHWVTSAAKYARAIELQFFGALRPIVAWDLQQFTFDWYIDDLRATIENVGPRLISIIQEVFNKAPAHKRGGVVGKDAMLPRVLFSETQEWINKL